MPHATVWASFKQLHELWALLELWGIWPPLGPDTLSFKHAGAPAVAPPHAASLDTIIPTDKDFHRWLSNSVMSQGAWSFQILTILILLPRSIIGGRLGEGVAGGLGVPGGVCVLSLGFFNAKVQSLAGIDATYDDILLEGYSRSWCRDGPTQVCVNMLLDFNIVCFVSGPWQN